MGTTRAHRGVRRQAREPALKSAPISIDYRKTDQLVRELDSAANEHGPTELVVAWIHSVAPEAPLAVAPAAARGDHPVRYVHVLGSAADDPSKPDKARSR